MLPAAARAEALSPDEALKHFKVADGFEVQLFASEPHVRQPVTMTFDDRGRMWVIQYLQYPTPAGLKPVTVDRYLRTKYDRVPEPPPKGPRGADKITILEDTDGDGRADRVKDFADGLESGLGSGHRQRRRVCRCRRLICCSIPIATATTCPTAIPRCCSKASAWKTRTPWSTRCNGDPTAGCTARKAAR